MLNGSTTTKNKFKLCLFVYTHTITPLEATDLFFITIVMSFQECHIKGIIQYVTFCDLASFTQHDVFEIHLSCFMYQ